MKQQSKTYKISCLSLNLARRKHGSFFFPPDSLASNVRHFFVVSASFMCLLLDKIIHTQFVMNEQLLISHCNSFIPHNKMSALLRLHNCKLLPQPSLINT